MELTIKIEIRKDKLAEVLVGGFSGEDFIQVGSAKAFDPCLIEDDYLVIRQKDEGFLAEVRIGLEELGDSTIYALAYNVMRKLRDSGAQANKEEFLFGMIEQFGSFNMEQANEFILKIIEMVE